MEEDLFAEGVLGKLTTQDGRAEIAADDLSRREGLKDFAYEPTPNGCRVIAKATDPTLKPEWGSASVVRSPVETGSRYANLEVLPGEVKSFFVSSLAESSGVTGADSWEHVKAIVRVIEGGLEGIRTDCVEFLPHTTDMEKKTRHDFYYPLYEWWEKVTEYCINKGKTPLEAGELGYPCIVVESAYRVLGTTVKSGKEGEHYQDEYGKDDATDRWGHWMGFSIDMPTKKWREKWDPKISKSEFYKKMEPYANASGLYRPFGDEDESHWRFDIRKLTPSTTLDEVRQLARELLKGK